MAAIQTMDGGQVMKGRGSVSGGTLMKVEADRNITQLGFAPVGVPPDTVTVSELETDGWAARQGIAVGDVLLSVGVAAISDLTKYEILRRIQMRPLRLTFLRPATAAGKSKDTLESKAEEILSKISAAKRALRAAAAEASSLNAAAKSRWPTEENSSDMLREAGSDVRAALAAVAAQLDLLAGTDHEVDEAEEEEEEAGLEENDAPDQHIAWPIEEDLPYSIEAKVAGCLGFAVVGEPPETVAVHHLDPDGFAAGEGVEVDDVLLMLNGSFTADLTKRELITKMRRRPLQLTFLRSCEDGLPPPPADQVMTATQLLGRALLDQEEDEEEEKTW